MCAQKVSLLLSLSILFVTTPVLVNASHHGIPPSPSNQTDQDAAHLGQVKLGLAAAFFFTVLIACGLPVVLVNCVQKSQIHHHSHTLALSPVPVDGPASADSHQPPSDPQTDNHHHHHHYNPAFIASKHSTEVPPADTSNGCMDWNQNATRLDRGSVDSEPLGSPGPMQTETTDLLTGRPVGGILGAVGGGSVWPHTRRDRANAGTASRRTTPDRRGVELHRNGAAGSRRLARGAERSSFAKKASLRLWFSRCNCCAAGIFLSSGFMELYVDVEESIEEAKTSLNVITQFPFAPFLTLLGFFLVLSIEQIVWTVRTYRMRSIARAAAATSSIRRRSTVTTPVSSPVRATADNTHTQFSFVGEPPAPRNATTPFLDADPTTDYYFSAQHSTASHGGHSHHHLDPVDSLDSFESVLRVVVLLVAMSVHSLFEGLAVGLQTTVTQTLALFSAILLHKLIIAVGIGMNLATVVIPASSSATSGVEDEPPQWTAGSNPGVEKHLANTTDHVSPHTGLLRPRRCTDRKTILYQSAFTFTLAVASPLGVLIGWALVSQNQSPVLLMVTAVLQGLACGTFFYVVFCELLPEEFRGHTGDRLGKLTFLIFGFLLVCIYSLLMPH